MQSYYIRIYRMSKKLYIETYGCQMNVADSEVVASVMQMAGYEPTDTEEDADAVFLNTSIPKPSTPSRFSACWAVWPSA